MRRRGGSKSGRIEEVGARRKDDGGVRTRIQEGGEREWIRGEAVSGGVQARDKRGD